MKGTLKNKNELGECNVPTMIAVIIQICIIILIVVHISVTPEATPPWFIVKLKGSHRRIKRIDIFFSPKNTVYLKKMMDI